MPEKFDVLIVGAGPAGATAAQCLASSGLKIALFDKAVFPRKKVCGDGLTHDVIKQLGLISPALHEAFIRDVPKAPCYGVEFIAPDHSRLHVPFVIQGENRPIYICSRTDFDNFMLSRLRGLENVRIFEGIDCLKITTSSDGVTMDTSSGSIEGKIILGADGINSFVARQMEVPRLPREYLCVSLRTYYRGLEPTRKGNSIEIYLLDGILPGYLWIFHLPGGIANVGMGMMAEVVNRKKINLPELFRQILSSEPLKSRLKGGEPIEAVKGYNLPLGGTRRSISGERFLLAGDAASLVDPISGEGVGNAIRSGRIAAAHILDCFRADDFSAKFNLRYDKEIYRRMLPEHKLHERMRRLFRNTPMAQFFLGSVARFPKMEAALHNALMEMNAQKPWHVARFTMKFIYTYTLLHLFCRLFTSTKNVRK
jgi:geranylgeranyl reductase family protein